VALESTFAAGDRIDRYEICELIGEGGMGAIYRALDTKLGRTVALKTMRTSRISSRSSEEARRRFMREALAASKVEHRNVVRVFDFGFADDGTPYLAMEFLKGRDLGTLVEQGQDFLPVAEVVDIMLSVCAAVRACHDVGIIHRDLKPSNIFLCDTDSGREVKILDFGVSKAPTAGELTQEGQILGTPQFLSPEQIDGKALPQTDQYAVGVVLYVCLTRVLPYQAHGNLSLLRAIDVGEFTPPRAHRPDLPAKLEAIILRAMSTAPADRFESMHALGQQLWEFASPEVRQQWRTYYLAPASPPPKASTHGMPAVEAMARGLGGGGEAADSLALAPTATMAPAGAPPVKAPVSAPFSAPFSVPITVPRGGRGKRGAVVLVIGAGLLAAAAGWLIMDRRPTTEPAKVIAPVVPAPLPAPAVPPATAAPAAPPVIAPAPPPASPPPAPPAAVAPAPKPPAITPKPPAPSPPRVDKHHRRNKHRPALEYTPDGVPIMP